MNEFNDNKKKREINTNKQINKKKQLEKIIKFYRLCICMCSWQLKSNESFRIESNRIDQSINQLIESIN